MLSEVTPVNSLVEAATLAAAVEQTGGFSMLAENYRFIDDIELVKRMVDDGRFGDISFAQGEYVHDTRDLAAEADGTRTWRSQPGRRGGRYCTHSLGPVLYMTGDRVAAVSCFAPEQQPRNALMLMQSAAGRLFKVRIDGGSPRPHNMAFYSVQGDARGGRELIRAGLAIYAVALDDTRPSDEEAALTRKPAAQPRSARRRRSF